MLSIENKNQWIVGHLAWGNLQYLIPFSMPRNESKAKKHCLMASWTLDHELLDFLIWMFQLKPPNPAFLYFCPKNQIMSAYIIWHGHFSKQQLWNSMEAPIPHRCWILLMGIDTLRILIRRAVRRDGWHLWGWSPWRRGNKWKHWENQFWVVKQGQPIQSYANS